MKLKTNIHFVVRYELFPFDVLVSINEKQSTLEKALKSKLPKHLHEEIQSIHWGTCGHTIMFSGNQTCIRINEPENNPVYLFATLQHEIFHAVEFMLTGVDIKLSQDSDEVFAYTIQYLTRKIYEQIFK